MALAPVQVSATSHSFTAARQVFELFSKVQLFLQHELPAIPGSQTSPGSRTPLPQRPSVNVVCATKPDTCPVAVSVYVTPTSSRSGAYSILVKLPFASA